MRGLKKNETLIYYSNFVEGVGLDDWDNPVGGYIDPEPKFVSLSANKGQANYQGFGVDLKYDREMVVYDPKCPINEYTRLWIDVETTKPHNYIVKKAAPSLNCTIYAIEKVNVNEENNKSKTI